MNINRVRVLLGGLAGGVAWVIWERIVRHFIVGLPRYQAAQSNGLFLNTSRYAFYREQWIVMIILAAMVLAYLYAAARQKLGEGPRTALKLGFLVGFVAAFPPNFAQAAWSPLDRMIALGSMLDIWGGCILATVVAGWLYKE